jgi:hypothetical protein
MDQTQFDCLAKSLGAATESRRGAARILGSGALAALLTYLGFGVAAAACRTAGTPCGRDSQCCSGVCKGPSGQQICRARRAGTCKPGQDNCAVPETVNCNDNDGNCFCRVTTTGARFCGTAEVQCTGCETDADCTSITGPGSACGPVANTFCGCVGDINQCIPPCPRR